MVRTGTAAPHQPPDRRGLAAHGRRPRHQRRRRTPAPSPSPGSPNSPRELLALVAELAQQASFPADEFERERRQMIEGLRIERTTPSFLASERLRRVLFGAHPYAIISPTEAQVEAYRREQLVEFYRAHYRPGNALLVAVGDFSSPAMLGEIERIFGSWTPGEVPRRSQPAAARAARPARASGASAGERADASSGRQSRHHAQASGLAAPRPGEFDLRRRVQFAPGDEHPRSQGLHLQPAQRRALPCASTAISACTRRCATTWSPPRSRKCSTKSTACARCPSAKKSWPTPATI